MIRLHVTFTPSEEVLSLRRDVEDLRQQLAELRAQFNHVELLYRSECLINVELQDLLRENGIPYREEIKQYRGMV